MPASGTEAHQQEERKKTEKKKLRIFLCRKDVKKLQAAKRVGTGSSVGMVSHVRVLSARGLNTNGRES